MTKRIVAGLLAMLLGICLLAGCSGDATATQKVTDVYTDKEVGFQLEAPEVGEEILIMKTSMGDIYIRLFPEAAPKAVENFTTHAKNGYYNGLTFHRVMEDFMIQGGDPKGDGTGGESVWGEDFEDEFDKKLLNIRGSLAMANSGVNTNGSQFFINQGDADAFAGRENYDYEKTHAQYANYYQQYCLYYAQQGQDFTKECPDLETFIELMGGISPDSRLVPDEVWDLYEKHGGSIHLDGAWRASGGHTVFGQVFKGMDVVDAIAAVETDDNDKPKEKVTINSIEVTTYAG
ncbi:MAG: peptidylprolyl isomerase [Clostridia bacterium]|nr:peptidylprolyl isomerase [Clostridia bacterium]